MAAKVLTNAYVLLNAQNVSAYVKQVTLRYQGEAVETTTMGATAKTRAPGLTEWQADVEFINDFAAAAADAILFPLVGTSIAVEIRPDAGARSVNNPAYTGTAVVTNYQAVGGSVGQVSAAPLTLMGSGVLARQTS